MNSKVEQVIKNWLDGPKESARRMVDYYGEPDEVSESRLIWYNTRDGWKRTVLVNMEVPHNFPSPHHDYLEQFIDYRVPLDMYSTLAEFDGSVIAERTKGELSARCGGTSMNFVAINLANDIVTGKKSVKEAREEYTQLYKDYKDGKKPPYTQAFQFDLPKKDTKDIDTATLK